MPPEAGLERFRAKMNTVSRRNQVYADRVYLFAAMH
jgi:hypothetical protein